MSSIDSRKITLYVVGVLSWGRAPSWEWPEPSEPLKTNIMQDSRQTKIPPQIRVWDLAGGSSEE